ncbi:MAG: hypothetical protein RL223_926 [Pseudomonadota bacterium]|jgi:hypothetical protein
MPEAGRANPHGLAAFEPRDLRDPRREDQTVSKANEAIAIRPKRGKLTLLSRRIYNALLYHAQRNGVEQPSYTINLSELIGDARFTSNNTELLKTHIRDMQATTIEWHTSIGEQRQWTSTQLLGTVQIHERGRGVPCTITWSYPEAIRERLVKPAHYTKVFLEISAQMRTYAASVLYELGNRYLTSPGRLTMREDLVWWASVLTGRSDIETVDYRILRRDVIKKALVELDTLNDGFSMEVVEHKRGRKVEQLQFRVVPKAQASLAGMEQGNRNVFDLQLVERIVALGLRRADAQDLYASTDEGALRAAVEHVEARMRNTGQSPLESPPAYLRDALRKGYAGQGGQAASSGGASATTAQATSARPTHALQMSSQAAGAGSSTQIPDGSSARPATAQGSYPGTVAGASAEPVAVAEEIPFQEKLRRLRDDWETSRAQEARERFDAVDEARRQLLMQRFTDERAHELPAPVARSWHKSALRSRIAIGSFHKWLATEFWPDPVTDVQLLEFALRRSR